MPRLVAWNAMDIMNASWRNRIRALLLTILVLSLGCGGGGPRLAAASPASAVSVVVSPATAEVEAGNFQPFTAAVTGTTNIAVTWSVAEGVKGGTITPQG